MPQNRFFEKKGPFPFRDIIKLIGCDGNFSGVENLKLFGIENLSQASPNEITFLNSSKYKAASKNTKAAACITSSNLSQFLPKDCIKINVKNILLAVTNVSKMFYPKADLDYPDNNLIYSDHFW